MKNKNIFWKIISVIFLVWLFLYLWNSSIYIYHLETGRVLVKTNKLTGNTYYKIIWGTNASTWKKSKKEKNN
jgi:hypothetical protein